MARGARRAGAAAARNRLLPEGRIAGPMPWIVAIMMFLTVLAAAAGLGLGRATSSLGADLAGRVTIQLVEADAETRRAAVARIVSALSSAPGVRAVRPLEEQALAAQLRPWLGEDMMAAELPIPALIDVELEHADVATMMQVRRTVRTLAPQARVEPHAAFLAPLSLLMASLAWLAALIVLLMGLATAAAVILAARGAHDSHRVTIEILHLMGATDVQIARLFQRRLALDALLGGLIGLAGALPVILLVGARLSGTESELMQAVALPPQAWAVLLFLPMVVVVLATITARVTVLRALARQL